MRERPCTSVPVLSLDFSVVIVKGLQVVVHFQCFSDKTEVHSTKAANIPTPPNIVMSYTHCVYMSNSYRRVIIVLWHICLEYTTIGLLSLCLAIFQLVNVDKCGSKASVPPI